MLGFNTQSSNEDYLTNLISGADLGSKINKKSALTTFIERPGWFYYFEVCLSAAAVNKAIYGYGGGGDSLDGPNAGIVLLVKLSLHTEKQPEFSINVARADFIRFLAPKLAPDLS